MKDMDGDVVQVSYDVMAFEVIDVAEFRIRISAPAAIIVPFQYCDFVFGNSKDSL